MKRLSLRPPECTAKSYMDKYSYVGKSEQAAFRVKMGERQTYCAHCKLCCWKEEQETCPHFKPDLELEAFYAAEEAKS